MALIETDEAELDHKAHRIVLEAAKGDFKSLIELARSLHQQDPPEFSYERNDEVRYSAVPTIKKYAGYVRALDLLDDHLKPAQSPSVYATLENFQNWLGNKVVQYLNNNGCSAAKIKDSIRELLHESPPKLPTPDNLFTRLGQPIQHDHFTYSLRLLSILRPQLFELRSRRLVLNREVLTS